MKIKALLNIKIWIKALTLTVTVKFKCHPTYLRIFHAENATNCQHRVFQPIKHKLMYFSVSSSKNVQYQWGMFLWHPIFRVVMQICEILFSIFTWKHPLLWNDMWWCWSYYCSQSDCYCIPIMNFPKVLFDCKQIAEIINFVTSTPTQRIWSGLSCEFHYFLPHSLIPIPVINYRPVSLCYENWVLFPLKIRLHIQMTLKITWR